VVLLIEVELSVTVSTAVGEAFVRLEAREEQNVDV
jgi:hypothetical protein